MSDFSEALRLAGLRVATARWIAVDYLNEGEEWHPSPRVEYAIQKADDGDGWYAWLTHAVSERCQTKLQAQLACEQHFVANTLARLERIQ